MLTKALPLFTSPPPTSDHPGEERHLGARDQVFLDPAEVPVGRVEARSDRVMNRMVNRLMSWLGTNSCGSSRTMKSDSTKNAKAPTRPRPGA